LAGKNGQTVDIETEFQSLTKALLILLFGAPFCLMLLVDQNYENVQNGTNCQEADGAI
jgi:hypothetical protein